MPGCPRVVQSELHLDQTASGKEAQSSDEPSERGPPVAEDPLVLQGRPDRSLRLDHHVRNAWLVRSTMLAREHEGGPA